MNKSIEYYIADYKNNNEVMSVLSKLILERKQNIQSMKELLNTDVLNKLGNIVNSNIDKAKLNEDILKLFPDTEKCIQILVSSIVCPNDLITTNINYSLDNLNLPVDVSSKIVTYVKNYIEKNYNLESNLYNIIKETLFTKGSYAQVIIPENLLDDFINKNDISIKDTYSNNHIFNMGGNDIFSLSKESLDPKVGDLLKGDINKIDYKEKDLGVSIEDTPFNLISFKRRTKQAKNLAKNEFYKIATEDMLEIEDIFKNPEELEIKETYAFNPFTSERESVTKPLVMNVNSEYIIPIYIKGDPKTHIGYFLLTDENYSPITNEGDISYCSNSNSGYSSNSFLVNKARESLYGMTKSDPTYEEMETIYSSMLENLLKDKLNNSKLGHIAQISNTEEIYKIMFSRSVRNNETKLIYLPEEMVVYYAHEYRANGTGKSMLEDLSVLYSIRAIAFFARIMAIIRNSINTTTFKIKLDENDQDPQSTIDDIVSTVLDSYQLSLPIGLTNISNLAEWAHTNGKEFVFEHPSIANIEVDKQNTTGEKIVPDSDLDEKLFEQICLRFGITADMVRSGFENDFATTVVTKNLLFAKMISLHHMWVNKCITNHVRKLLHNDSVVNGVINNMFQKEIKTIKSYNKNADKDITNMEINYKGIGEKELIKLLTYKSIDTIDCYLPEPDVTDATNLAEMFKNEIESVEDFLGKILSDDILPEDLAGESSRYIGMVREMLVGLHAIDWASKNGLYKDIMNFVLDTSASGEDKSKLSQFYNDINERLTFNVYGLLKGSVKLKRKYGEKFDKLEEELEPEEDEEEFTTDDSGDSMDTSYDESIDDTSDGGDDLTDENDSSDDVDDTLDTDDDQQEEIDDLEDKVDYLEDKIDDLEYDDKTDDEVK